MGRIWKGSPAVECVFLPPYVRKKALLLVTIHSYVCCHLHLGLFEEFWASGL